MIDPEASPSSTAATVSSCWHDMPDWSIRTACGFCIKFHQVCICTDGRPSRPRRADDTANRSLSSERGRVSRRQPCLIASVPFVYAEQEPMRSRTIAVLATAFALVTGPANFALAAEPARSPLSAVSQSSSTMAQTPTITIQGSSIAAPAPRFHDTNTMAQATSNYIGTPPPQRIPRLTTPYADITAPRAPLVSSPVHSPMAAPLSGMATTPSIGTGPSLSNTLSKDDPGTTFPSDANGAVGPTDAVQTVNAVIGFFDRATQTRSYSTTIQKFLTLPDTDFLFDPHVIYDPIGQHYLLVVGDATANVIQLAISPQNNNGGVWCSYSIPAGVNFDLPMLGVDNSSIKISSFNIDSSGAQTDSRLYLLPRTAVETCTPTFNYRSWTGVRDVNNPFFPTYAFHAAPIINYSTAANTPVDDFIESSWNGGSSLSYFSTNNLSLTVSRIPTPSYNKPSSAAQAGTTANVDTGMADIKQAIRWSDGGGQLYTALTSNHDWGAGNVNSTVLWMSLAVSPGVQGQVLQSLEVGQPGVWLFYPSVTPDLAGNALFNVSTSGRSQYPSDGVFEIPVNTTTVSSTIPYAGTAPNTDYLSKNCSSSTPCYRYGDYTSLFLDPLDHTRAYAVGTVQGAGSSTTWHTVLTPVWK